MNNRTILPEAHALFNDEGRGEYDQPSESFAPPVALQPASLGGNSSSHDVSVCMALRKLSRQVHSDTKDPLFAAAGYIGLAAVPESEHCSSKQRQSKGEA